MSRSGAVWSGWILFAAVMMALIGSFNVLEGLAAIAADDFFVRAEGDLLVFSFTAWGWMILAWGVVLLAVGIALLTGKDWARWPAVAIAGVNALGHAAFMAFPIWNVLVIGLSVVVIFALTVRWDVAQADLDG